MLLLEGTWTHDHPITYETAKSFGLPVRTTSHPSSSISWHTIRNRSATSRPSSIYRNVGAVKVLEAARSRSKGYEAQAGRLVSAVDASTAGNQ